MLLRGQLGLHAVLVGPGVEPVGCPCSGGRTWADVSANPHLQQTVLSSPSESAGWGDSWDQEVWEEGAAESEARGLPKQASAVPGVLTE